MEYTVLRCAVPDCGQPRVKRVWCHKHYSRWKRHGDPLIQKRATSALGKDQAAKRAFVIQYKLEHGCADCGYDKHHVALDFDHRPGEVKVRDVKAGQQLGWEALLAEVAKCDVVCANCHRNRTYLRQLASPEGGDVI